MSRHHPFFLLATAILLVFLLSALVIPKKLILSHAAVLFFCCPDITQDNLMVEEFGELKVASIWQLSFLGEPAVTWLLALFAIYFYRLRFLRFDLNTGLVLLFFIALPLATSLLYGYLNSVSRVVADLKFGIGLTLGFSFFFSGTIREQFQDKGFISLLMGGVFA